MRSMRNVIVALVACAGLLAAPGALFAQGTPAPSAKKVPTVKAKLAYVDVDRAVGETEDGLRAKAILTKNRDREQSRVAEVEDELRQMQDRLTQLAKAADPKVQALAIDYQKKLQDYNDLIKRINNEIAAREDQLFAPIEAKVRDVVVDKKSIQYVNSAKVEDLTEQVIREYNWGAGTGVGKGAASTSAAPEPTTPPPAPTASDKPKTVINPI